MSRRNSKATVDAEIQHDYLDNAALDEQETDSRDARQETYTVKTEGESYHPVYFDRYLIIQDTQFIIVPNGGTGDCLFKAIAQAISEDNVEGNHVGIRCQIVDFIVDSLWDNLKESIEIQHISGNEDLLEEWREDSVQCYRKYMALSGTQGSFIELTAAAQLHRFNFSSIQEYCKDVKTYRIENFFFSPPASNGNQDQLPNHYFLFTGDYESGHWEHLVPLTLVDSKNYLKDGTYHGILYHVINGTLLTFDDWLCEFEEKNYLKHTNQISSNPTTPSSPKEYAIPTRCPFPESVINQRVNRDRSNSLSTGGDSDAPSKRCQHAFPQQAGLSSPEDGSLDTALRQEQSNSQRIPLCNHLQKLTLENDNENNLIPQTKGGDSVERCSKILFNIHRAPDSKISLTKSNMQSKSPTSQSAHERRIKGGFDEDQKLEPDQKKKGCIKSFFSYLSSALR